jgi:hypothetical protein
MVKKPFQQGRSERKPRRVLGKLKTGMARIKWERPRRTFKKAIQ